MKKLINIQEYLPSTITSRKAVEIINDASPIASILLLFLTLIILILFLVHLLTS